MKKPRWVQPGAARKRISAAHATENSITLELEGEPPIRFWTQFGRAQLSSFLASMVDLSAMFILVEISGVHYTLAVALGAFAGALTNFLMNRHWSFGAVEEESHRQAWRYAQVSAGSLALNVAGTYALTEFLHFKYGFSKIVASLAVGFFFNFPMHRQYVFKVRSKN